MAAASRDRVQADFIADRLDVIVEGRISTAGKRPARAAKRPARAGGRTSAARESTPRRLPTPTAAGAPSPLAQARLFDALKAWRLGEARRRRIPAFRIMPNRTLDAIAEARPQSEAELLAVHGMGPTLVKKYGEKLLAIVAAGE